MRWRHPGYPEHVPCAQNIRPRFCTEQHAEWEVCSLVAGKQAATRNTMRTSKQSDSYITSMVFFFTRVPTRTHQSFVISTPWQLLAKFPASEGQRQRPSERRRQAGSQSISIGRMRSTLLASLLVLSTVVGICSAQDKEDANAASKVVALLEKSGHTYTKVKDGVWEINFTGDNLKEFSVRFALGGNILVSMARLAGRQEIGRAHV